MTYPIHAQKIRRNRFVVVQRSGCGASVGKHSGGIITTATNRAERVDAGRTGLIADRKTIEVGDWNDTNLARSRPRLKWSLKDAIVTEATRKASQTRDSTPISTNCSNANRYYM